MKDSFKSQAMNENNSKWENSIKREKNVNFYGILYLV